MIRDPIEVERYRADPGARDRMRAELGLGPGAFLFGYVSRLSVPKQPVELVQAFARVAARFPESHFVLVGDGALREATERKVAELGFGDRVRLMGLRRDVPAFLSAFDAFVLMTEWEGLPRVLPQALAAGLPIVTTEVDGTPEAVREGETGYLVAPGDVEVFSERMCALAADPARARAMGQAGMLLVDEFSAWRVVEQLAGLYEELMARRPGR